MTADEQQTPVYLECRSCGHQWIAAWLPMIMGEFSKTLKRARFPKGCKGRKQIYLYEPGRVPEGPALAIGERSDGDG